MVGKSDYPDKEDDTGLTRRCSQPLAAARLEVEVTLSCSQLSLLLPSTFGVTELDVR